MDAKEKLDFFNEIRKEFYLVSRRGFSNAWYHLDDKHIGQTMRNYCSGHNAKGNYEKGEENEEDKDNKACSCIIFNLESDFYRFLNVLEDNAEKCDDI